ncbi:MAG: type II toxin-antitoxin system PemK/MazF family toxin [Candidatus Geothermincolia bacterium]
MSEFIRGEVWLATLDPVRGREQAGTRPVLVVSDDRFSNGPAGLVITVPMTTKDRNIASHVQVEASEGGLERTSFIMCEQVRNLSKERMVKRLGTIDRDILASVEHILRVLMRL